MSRPVNPQDRRANDRRRGDRRRSGASSAWNDDDTQAADSRFAQHEADADGGGSFARVVRLHAAARAAVGVGLVVAQGATVWLGSRGVPVAALLSVAYAAQAIVMWLLPRFLADPRAAAVDAHRRGRTRRYWLATIGVDLVAFSVLHLLETSASFNYAALLVLPVLMAGVLMPRLLALATTSLAALVLLFAAWRLSDGDGDLTLRMAQSGLGGMGFFVIVLLAGELAARLAREEMAARGSLELARQQAQLNRLVIQEMSDGVMVVDRNLRVRAANPAARALLVSQGLAPRAPFALDALASWRPLMLAAGQAFESGRWPSAGREIALDFDDGQTRSLRMRVRFTRPVDEVSDTLANEPYCVLLLEDVRTAQARLRQEKLAAMGRVSAGIAHEIRNPLAAISQANALLLEEPLPAAQQRLARMVEDNVQRLKRIVDDVMELAPGEAGTAHPIDATASLGAAAAEWAQTAGLPLAASSRLRVDLPDEPLGVLFDTDHLRRVLVNLLDNALRHASDQSGAILLRLAPRDSATVLMQVFSDGTVIAPEVERYLFEPFFSTRSRGSGLGLYICRELCERYGASIDYRPRPTAERLRNEFVVTLRRATLPGAAATLPLNA